MTRDIVRIVSPMWNECFTYYEPIPEAWNDRTTSEYQWNKSPDIKSLTVTNCKTFGGIVLPLSVGAVGGAIVEIPTGDWAQLQQHRVNAAATADAFMNYVDRSRMVSHIIPVSGVSGRNSVKLKVSFNPDATTLIFSDRKTNREMSTSVYYKKLISKLLNHLP